MGKSNHKNYTLGQVIT